MRGLILIDLDETLVDRDAVLRAWAHEVASTHGQPESAEWLIGYDRHDGKVRDRESFLIGVAEALGWDSPVDELLANWPTMFGARYRLERSVADALTHARASGFRVAVVSNGDARRQRAKVEAMRLADLVDAVVISGEVGIRKPDRGIFEAAAQGAGADLEGETWILGDDPVADLGGARSIGARGVWVNRTGRVWPADLPPPDAEFLDPVAALMYVLSS